MQRWFLSYNSRDFTLVDGLQDRAAAQGPGCANILRTEEPARRRLLVAVAAHEGMSAGARDRVRADRFWRERPRALASHRILRALDRRVKQQGFPLILVLLDGQSAPGLPFLRQLHWITTPTLRPRKVWPN